MIGRGRLPGRLPPGVGAGRPRCGPASGAGTRQKASTYSSRGPLRSRAAADAVALRAIGVQGAPSGIFSAHQGTCKARCSCGDSTPGPRPANRTGSGATGTMSS